MKDLLEKGIKLDQLDELKSFRDLFEIGPGLLYLDGNSLGRMPLKTKNTINSLLDEEWGNRLIRSWNEKWLLLNERLSSKIAKIVGAHAEEIFVGDTTSLNLYKLAFGSLSSQSNRKKILTDTLNFPSDLYVFQGLIQNHFPDHVLEQVKSSDSIHADVDALYSALDADTALLSLSHVTYKSAYLYNMEEVNGMAKDAGSHMIWDLSHAVGAVAVDLNKTKTDMAVGCTYKYLNGGPGSPAFLYVSKELQEKIANPIWSWFSHQQAFAFDPTYHAHEGIQKFGISTPQILSLAAMEAGLDITLAAGMEKIRNKSRMQSEYLIELIQTYLLPLGFLLASPMDTDQRGSHISIRHPEAYRINRALIEPKNQTIAAVIPDFRPPDNIRLGITPLYTTYQELHDTVIRIAEIIRTEEYKRSSFQDLIVP